MKPNDTPLYVHRNSNHPPSILRNIPKAVNKRLCSISANEQVFDEACPPFQAALEKSGYDHKLVYTPCEKQKRKNKNRSRNITYFNPPYSQNVQTNIGEKFLKLIDKHFPPNHVLAKIVNRNNVKISYRCMPNLKKAISRHNHRVQEGT